MGITPESDISVRDYRDVQRQHQVGYGDWESNFPKMEERFSKLYPKWDELAAAGKARGFKNEMPEVKDYQTWYNTHLKDTAKELLEKT